MRYDKLFQQALDALLHGLADRFVACELGIIAGCIILLLADLWMATFSTRKE
jgi:hypothetical protein